MVGDRVSVVSLSSDSGTGGAFRYVFAIIALMSTARIATAGASIKRIFFTHLSYRGKDFLSMCFSFFNFTYSI